MPGNQHGKPDVFVIDTVGAHRGMHYYNFALVSALNQIGARAVLISTPETARHSLRPGDVPVRGAFRGIYGDKPQWFRGLRYALSLLRIAWWAWRDRPGIAHFHFYQIPLLDYILLQWLKLLGIRSITTVHDVLPFDLGTDFTSPRGKVYHRLYSESSGLILNSEHASDALAKLDRKLLDRSVVIAQGGYPGMHQRYSMTRENARANIGLELSIPVILVFGTIKPNKRLDLVMKAMVRITQSYPEARLVVVGKLQDRDVLKDVELANQLGIASNVFWRLGHVTDEELGWYLSAADVVVFSYQWIYQSAALLMALSFEKPVVATAVGSNVHLVQNNKTGILVPPGDPQTLANAIQGVLDDPARANAMGKAAYRYITTELSWDRIARSTLAFYHQVQSN